MLEKSRKYLLNTMKQLCALPYTCGGRFLFVFKGFGSLSNNRNALPLFYAQMRHDTDIYC